MRLIMPYPVRVLASAAIVLSAACAVTKISSVVAPEALKAHYRRIMVNAPFKDLGTRRAAEDQFAASDQGDSVQFIPSYQVLFPGRSYSAEEARGAVQRDSIDAELFIVVDTVLTSTLRTPTTTSTKCTATTYSGECRSRTTGGDNQPTGLLVSFTAKLVDVSTGRSVWVATENTKGEQDSTAEQLVRSMANATVKKLRQDGLIP